MLIPQIRTQYVEKGKPFYYKGKYFKTVKALWEYLKPETAYNTFLYKLRSDLNRVEIASKRDKIASIQYNDEHYTCIFEFWRDVYKVYPVGEKSFRKIYKDHYPNVDEIISNSRDSCLEYNGKYYSGAYKLWKDMNFKLYVSRYLFGKRLRENDYDVYKTMEQLN